EGVNRNTAYGDREESVAFNRSPNFAYIATPKPASPGKRRAGGGGGGGVVGSGTGRGVGAAPPSSPTSKVVDVDEASAVKLSVDDQKRADLQRSVHPAVLAVIDRLKAKSTTVSPEELRFVHDGKAEIQIWFNDKSDAVMAKLKQLGFEIVLDPKTAKMVIGRLPIE